VPDQLRSMRVFTAVVAVGSFSAASRQLGMSQTMVTKHVTALEDALGIQLLRRTTQRVTATEAGERYAEDCRRILEEVEEANNLAIAQHIEPRGVLRLSAPLSFGLREINPILGDFARLHRDLRIDLELNDRLVDLLDGGWDMAVRIGLLKDSAMLARKLVPCRTIVCASPDYLATHGTPKRLEDLAGHNCLGYSLSNETRVDQWSFGPDARTIVSVSTPFRANNGDTISAMAVAGLGIAYQPSFILGEDLRAGRLVPIALDHPTVLLHTYAVFARANKQPAKVRAMIDFLADRWGPVPPWDRDIP
jgi:DNA-binding transcriptional LysR family regulator